MDSPYWKGPLPGVDVQRRLPVETFRAQAEQHSGGGQKVFGFSPESMFALRPESCSESARNPVRLHPGMVSGLPRNTHPMRRVSEFHICMAASRDLMSPMRLELVADCTLG